MIETIVAAVVAALASGATAGVTEITKKGLSDGYEKLKSLMLSHDNEGADIENALTKVEQKPESEARRAVLVEELEGSGAANDAAIQQQANVLLELVKSLPEGNTSGQIASGTGIAQADRRSSASVRMINQQK